jgi:hypothetical protein
MAKKRTIDTTTLEPAADLSYPPDTSSGRWVTVHTPYGAVLMTPEGAQKYADEVDAEYAQRQDVDALAKAFDASMGTTPTSKPGAPMDEMLTPEMTELLQQYAQEGRLGELFQPFQQEQSVLDQQMQLGQGMREQRGPQRSTPTGALFGGLSSAIGNIGGAMLQKKGLEGQAALGKRMQGDASGRVGAILKAAMQRKGINPDTGLMTPAVDDATLAGIFSGG